LLRWSATQLAAKIQAGEVSAREVLQTYVERIEQVNGELKAIVNPLWDHGTKYWVDACDQAYARGLCLGPLHGVPFTVKECIQVAGTPSTLGLTTRKNLFDEQNAPVVDRLYAAGGVLIGKTNVPQLMMYHESDNPVYGCTNHPLDFRRSPGGSSGGEAAAVAAFCSPLGIGNDLGGSIRLPAAWCGLSGLKPTMHRLMSHGVTGNFHGMHAMRSELGPMARSVEDLYLALQVMYGEQNTSDVLSIPLLNPNEVDISKLKVLAWADDGYFPACAAAQRAVREAAAALSSAGVQVEWIQPELNELIDLYYALMDADGGADAKRIAAGSKLDHRIARILWMGGVQGWLRDLIIQMQVWQGRTWLARILRHAKPRSADGYWQLCHRLAELTREFIHQQFEVRGAHAILTPAHALPALPHGVSVDLLPAASYAYLANLLGLPAGVTPWTTVQEHETTPPVTASSFMNGVLSKTMQNSAGLPIAVQIVAPAWREDWVLALLKYLEEQRKL
jgi:fatty acid amide hydrolase